MEEDMGSGISSHHYSMGVREILSSLSGSDSHTVLVYPDIETLREIYSNYIQQQLDKNQIVLFLPYFETVEGVRNILSVFQNTYGKKIKVEYHLRDGSLLILDSYEVFFNNKIKNSDRTHSSSSQSYTNNRSGIVLLLRIMQSHCKKIDKDGVTMLVDFGVFFTNAELEDILNYEKTVLHSFSDKALTHICLYHQRDFDTRLNNDDKAILLNEHGKTLLMLD